MVYEDNIQSLFYPLSLPLSLSSYVFLSISLPFLSISFFNFWYFFILFYWFLDSTFSFYTSLCLFYEIISVCFLHPFSASISYTLCRSISLFFLALSFILYLSLCFVFFYSLNFKITTRCRYRVVALICVQYHGKYRER